MVDAQTSLAGRECLQGRAHLRRVILILHTTLYRGGGAGFAQVARTLAGELRSKHPHADVVVRRVESKGEVRACFSEIAGGQGEIEQLHLVVHAGMYGPMFGTTDWPEQFSPYEWRTLQIPFATRAEAFIHACRSARWFAPFFARTFGVRTHGYHWYTTFSAAPDRFRWAPPWRSSAQPLYVFGCPGRKSHGLAASVRKYTGGMRAEARRTFEPSTAAYDTGYDAVAAAYDEVFDDIGVRRSEVRWIEQRMATLGRRPRVLDIGCGNGALLQRLAPRIRGGLGVDVSSAMVERARRRCAAWSHLSFETVNGPRIPAEDGSIDIAISMLSFRYLDWDPLLAELARVMHPEGRLLLVDMVDKPIELRNVPRMLVDRLRAELRARNRPGYRRRLAAMVHSQEWRQMLHYNPMRALHEYVWYLGSRFPRGTMYTLDHGLRARIIAFDTDLFSGAQIAEMQYP